MPSGGYHITHTAGTQKVKPVGLEEIPVRDPIPTHLEEVPVMEEKKSFLQSKTVWGIIAALVGFGLESIGLSSSTEFLRDGLQLDDISHLLKIGGMVLTAFGIRMADKKLEGLTPSGD